MRPQSKVSVELLIIFFLAFDTIEVQPGSKGFSEKKLKIPFFEKDRKSTKL
jgi:hypothetical protein